MSSFQKNVKLKPLKRIFLVLADLNHASQKGLQTIFDSSVGRSTVNLPLRSLPNHTTEASVQIRQSNMRDNNCIRHGARIQPLCSRMGLHIMALLMRSSPQLVWLLLVNTSKARFSIRNTSSVWINRAFWSTSSSDPSKLSFNLVCHLSVGKTRCLVPLKNWQQISPTLVAFGADNCR